MQYQKQTFPRTSTSFADINTAALSAGLPAQWYPKAKRYGQSLRIGNLAGDPGSSLWIDLRSGAWKDHASGDSGGDLISLYAAREGIGQNEARQKISEFLGCYAPALEKTVCRSQKTDNSPKARSIWRETVAITDTDAEQYLRLRAITLELPASLRFHAGLYHWRSKKSYPAMVAAVTIWPSRTVQAIHRTWLDGALKANIKPPRMALGPLSGGSVRLAPVHDVMAVAEGIETALSFMQATGIPSWAVLSTSNYSRRVPNKVVSLPDDGTQYSIPQKVKALAKWVWANRSGNGSRVDQMLTFVLYGGSTEQLPERLWQAVSDPKWKIDGLGVSALGEIVGWALPDIFPPRNGRTSKALRSLGYDVKVHVE